MCKITNNALPAILGRPPGILMGLLKLGRKTIPLPNNYAGSIHRIPAQNWRLLAQHRFVRTKRTWKPITDFSPGGTDPLSTLLGNNTVLRCLTLGHLSSRYHRPSVL